MHCVLECKGWGQYPLLGLRDLHAGCIVATIHSLCRFSEFTHPDDQRMVAWMNISTAYVESKYNKKMYIKVLMLSLPLNPHHSAPRVTPLCNTQLIYIFLVSLFNWTVCKGLHGSLDWWAFKFQLFTNYGRPKTRHLSPYCTVL